MPNLAPLLIYVCAYHMEAIAIIDRHKLKKDLSIDQFPYYCNGNIGLIETGPGKQNTAIACAYITGKFNINKSAWLNIGISGHRSLPIGQGVLCNKVTDDETRTNYYPDMRFKDSLTVKALLTVNRPESQYESDNMYDMEASGFFHSCSRFSTLEHIHSYKVISDNQANSFDSFNKAQTQDLINHCLMEITSLSSTLIEAIIKYQKTYCLPVEFQILVQKLHFSVTQQEQLKILLRHWHALSTDSLLKKLPKEHQNSKQLLNNISALIDMYNSELSTTLGKKH